MKIAQNRFCYIRCLAVVLAGMALTWFSAFAEVRLPSVFSDNMVLQRGVAVPVWGWAQDGEKITVTCQGRSASTTAKNGKWMVRLRPLKTATAANPETLVIQGSNKIVLNNVLVGEVWLASGQSNMQWPLSQAFQPEADISASANRNIRLFTVDRVKSDTPLEDLKVPARWVLCQPDTVPNFSAVAYYFARALQRDLQVPVGIIHTSWGGSPAEVWMSREALEKNPAYKRDILDPVAASLQQYQQQLAAFQSKTAELKAKGLKQTGQPPREPWVPTQLYNAMIHPLAPFAVKGAIWYQGESNAGRAWQYRTLFPDMIKNWRALWGQEDFYFFAVQLAPFQAKGRTVSDQPGDSDWAELREAQLLAARKLPDAGLAVITDVGEQNDIHPRKKGPVGERLSLLARGIAYKERNLVYSGPAYKKMQMKGDKAILTFDHAGKGLEARGGALKGFAICGPDHRWQWATAEITGKNQVTVTSPLVLKPVAVRYGWSDCPDVNLWNQDGLPASPFRTDDFPMITQVQNSKSEIRNPKQK